MTGNWTKLLESPEIPSILDFESLSYSLDGTLLVTLLDGKLCVQVKFSDILAHFLTDERNRLRTWTQAGSLLPSPLLKSDDSHLKRYFLEESEGIYDERFAKSIIHYMISTPEEVIDVLSTVEPLVQVTTID
jgi:hypothetical protein